MMFTRLSFSALGLLFVHSMVAAQVPTVQVQSAGSPVVSARCWTQAVGQRPDGGYTFIAQYFNHQSKLPNAAPEWVLVDLDTGRQQVFNLPGYSNSNYHQKNCLRAANGRIFFSASGGHIHYYDPATNSMKTLGTLLPEKSGYSFFYRLEFGPDGMLYATTQSSNRRAGLARINPVTLEHKVWLDLGDPERKDSLTYGYYHRADPPWVYIGVGQNVWRLVALNTETGEHHVLGAPATWIEIDSGPIGVRAKLIFDADPNVDLKGKTSAYVGHVLHTPTKRYEFWWCHDGKLYPADSGASGSSIPGKPMSERHPVAKAAPVAVPEVQAGQPRADGTVPLQWRMGEEGPWREGSLKIVGVEPVGVESLIAMSSGELLGSTMQYNGFFHWSPNTGKTVAYGRHGPSRAQLAEVQGKIYITGYPNSILFVYDPAQAWEEKVNPKPIGHFADVAHTHYPYYLIPAPNNRLYFAGRCERNYTGSGVAYHKLDDGTFHGHRDNLNFFLPRGFVVMPDREEVVFSGQLTDDANATTPKPAEAQLVVYDMDLKEKSRLTVKPGLVSTGNLYRIGSTTHLLGRIEQAGKNTTLYRFDLQAARLIGWRELTGGDWDVTRRPDGSLWLIESGQTLHKLNLENLETTPAVTFSRPMRRWHWIGNKVYGTNGADELLSATVAK